MVIQGEELKSILRYYPTGVTIVTTVNKGVYYGLTVNSFTSISLNPPLVMVSIGKGTRSNNAIAESKVYAVNILPYDMYELAIRFAAAPPEERFRGLRVFTAKTGAPIIDGVLAYLDCRVVEQFEVADHVLYIGLVEDGKLLNPDKRPVIYLNRNYLQAP